MLVPGWYMFVPEPQCRGFAPGTRVVELLTHCCATAVPIVHQTLFNVPIKLNSTTIWEQST